MSLHVECSEKQSVPVAFPRVSLNPSAHGHRYHKENKLVIGDFETSEHILNGKTGIDHRYEQNYRSKSTKKKVHLNSDDVCTRFSLTVDCSGLKLDHINSSWFPNTTEVILFKQNLLNKLPNSTFSHLIHLKHLDVTHNNILLIEPLAFEGLINLKYLRLGSNKISFEKVSVDIFKPLESLLHLDLWFLKDQRCDVPSAMLQPLTHLQSLTISIVSFSLYLGPEFLNFKHLELLKISGSSRMITNKSFENVGGLRELVVREMMFINFVDINALVHFRNLTSITLIGISFDLKNALPILWPFKGRYMKEIYALLVTTQKSIPNPWKNGLLTKNDLIYVTDICVETVSMIRCGIYYVTQDALSNVATWNSCLRNIVISRNPLIGSYFALYPVSLLQNIETVVVNKAQRSCEQFSDFPRLGLNRNEFIEQTVHNNRTLDGKALLKSNDFLDETNSITKDIDMLQKKTFYILNGTIYIHVSKSLLSWDSKQLFPEGSLDVDITIQGANNLQYIDVSDSGYHTFSGKLQGLTSLRTAIVSGNNLKVFSESFLDGFLGLENLALSKCQLDKDFVAMKSNRIFQNTRQLKELDISENSLNALSPGTFSTNSDLRYIIISGNQFKDIPFDFKYTPNLKNLDISNNAITTLTTENTRAIDLLNSRNGGFQLMLNGNILSCGCNDLSFLKWLNSTLVRLDNNRNYTCMNKDGERTNTLAFSDLESLWRQCWGEFFFYIALITLCLYITGAVLIFLMLRNKNFLVSYFLQLLGHFKLHTRLDYKTDVYIGYSDEDYRFPCIELREHLERTLKLSTFVIDRDLLASLDKASGIVDAINLCWRILLVCSESFLKNEDWSMFTMRSAMYAQSPANPAKIVVMVHTSCLSLIPTELLSVVNDENILVVFEWKINYILGEKLRTRLLA
ncbi:TLR cluster1 member 27 [Biomphalaria glabrata]